MRLPENLFYTRGINAGIRYAQRQYPDAPGLVLLNNDIKVRPGWLANLTSDLETNVGLVGNKHLRMDDPTLVVHGGTADLLTGMHKAGPDDPHFDRRSRDVWVTFACVYITQPCLDQVGLLDERMLHFTVIPISASGFGWRVLKSLPWRFSNRAQASRKLRRSPSQFGG